jgi:nitrite reductase/ring-hydroxylating ferredoxin subunit
MPSTETLSSWYNVGALAQLEANGRAVTKLDGKQIAVFDTESGLFAINNRCPHEGYPLLEGTLQGDCILACNWHGWTFDLETGETLQGRDPVRKYAVERRGEDIWIQIVEDAPELGQQKALDELSEAYEEHNYDRMARALCRLRKHEGVYEDAVRRVLLTGAAKLERGFGHAHAGLCDWIQLSGTEDDLRLVAFLEAIGHFSWDSLFSPSKGYTTDSVTWDAEGFLNALEAMDEDAAVAIVNGAFEGSMGFADIKSVFRRFIFAHYAGFGHPAIYLVKLEELIEKLGKDVEHSLCLQLTRYLCVAAREDLIPEFRQFKELLLSPPKERHALDKAELISGSSLKNLLPAVAGASGSSEDIWEQLLCAAALDMLRFEEGLQHGIEQPISQNVGWLDFTHAITFAEAVYELAKADGSIWNSGNLQLACFIGRNSKFLGANQYSRWMVPDQRIFLARQKSALFDMDVGEYIYAVHRLKLVVAVEKLLGVVRPATANLLLAALNRFLNSHVRQRHSARSAFQAKATIERE